MNQTWSGGELQTLNSRHGASILHSNTTQRKSTQLNSTQLNPTTMSKNNSIPPSILSFVKKSSSPNDDSDDDDRAFLLPSHGSSFNLADDSEVIKPRVTRKNGKQSKPRKGKQQQNQLRDFDSSNSNYSNSARSSSTAGSGGYASGGYSQKQNSLTTGDSYFHRDGGDNVSNQQLADDILSPIAGSFSNHSSPVTGGPSNLHNVQSKESIRSNKTIHSGKSYKSHKSSGGGSKRSGKSSHRRRKVRRDEKRRGWIRKHQKRRILVSEVQLRCYTYRWLLVVLHLYSFSYSSLCAYLHVCMYHRGGSFLLWYIHFSSSILFS